MHYFFLAPATLVRRFFLFMLIVPGIIMASGPCSADESSPTQSSTPAAETPSEPSHAPPPDHPPLFQSDEPPNTKIAVRVNDEPIYETTVERELNKMIQKYKKYGFSGQNKEAVAHLRAQVLDSLIEQTVIIQASRTIEVEDMDQRIAKELESLKEAAGSEENFEGLMKARYGTMERLNDSLRNQAQMNAYLEKQGLMDPDVPEEEIREFYEKSKSGWTQPETAKVRHILLGVPKDADEKTWTETEQKAVELHKKLLAGEEDFDKAAKEMSACEQSKDKGGDLDFIQKGFMPKEFDEIAFSLPIGELSKPVKTSFGYHIMKVEEKREAGITPFEELKDFLGKYLKNEKKTKAIQAHMKKLREEAKVEIVTE